MRLHKTYYVYILANRSHTIYVGVTSDLERRVREHKCGLIEGFTAQYNIKRLVYFERYAHPQQAIDREKELKGWRREKKVALIVAANRYWVDLAKDWFPELR